ncbi:uncharacterized protein HD556DRAFT_367588 [Suillus plorans]|uniref:Uncharacterized protein n=1 Tax=Suillus plorans TaxID=116603 RepID=A0A9P7AVM2_9AGAM|nr:uncharacterized protein HD556DRAFT_367588 [Suillus plorans]KAG1795673.1 hypothetical protein HD556DRAFT_367588 [Suillus plorans]
MVACPWMSPGNLNTASVSSPNTTRRLRLVATVLHSYETQGLWHQPLVKPFGQEDHDILQCSHSHETRSAQWHEDSGCWVEFCLAFGIRYTSHSSLRISSYCFMIARHLANLIRYCLVSGQEFYWLNTCLNLPGSPLNRMIVLISSLQGLIRVVVCIATLHQCSLRAYELLWSISSEVRTSGRSTRVRLLNVRSTPNVHSIHCAKASFHVHELAQ